MSPKHIQDKILPGCILGTTGLIMRWSMKPEINSFKFQLTSYTNLKELPKAFNILKIRQ